jgi:uncharacterized protein YndB with AHSA1/START domain
MEARDGSMGFDFEGTYTVVVPMERIEYLMDDGRAAVVDFLPGPNGVTVRVTFDAESTFPAEHQRAGWQAISDRFASHVRQRAGAPPPV